ncbi:putative sulfate/molybdate transporter [Actinotalea fermentans]|uniref:Sulfate transporter n=1 Tax=Actinotalea fermentans TaxID=43671 RepID=A0A511YUB3_9CELL|nr:putative sulfate/molybdate transporter [Actinotalea fermentans]KGM15314.1 hypothetical protein N867_09860 [Actinotalea fermentans ATCC 43279 = JCM 9966 = DSM 3133]GEN78782.1 hypothetical protein AFE02nite_05160 [Actinotalea fermentans]
MTGAPGTATAAHTARTDAPSWSWWREASGSVADLGVLVPIAVALIVSNGLAPTAVLLPAGLAYLAVAALYRLPVAVQPLKAFGAVAIAVGAGADVIAAGALLMGAVFVVLGATGWLDRVARAFPQAVVRGVQLAVALTFAKIAWGLVVDPSAAFVRQPGVAVAAVLAVALAVLLLRWPVLALVVVALGLAVAVVLAAPDVAPGPSALTPAMPDAAAFASAAVLLVLPQLPLTFANSCLAPADAARQYFGDRAARVTPSRLALSLGAANLVAGGIGGMPVCHGAGGLSAHHAAGARTWRAPALIGGALVLLALVAGRGLAGVLGAFPVPVLAALLVVGAVAHARLLRDVRGWAAWSVVVVVGVLGVVVNLALGMLVGLAAHLTVRQLTGRQLAVRQLAGRQRGGRR